MTVWICVGCGIEHRDTEAAPDVCAICRDDRQYVPGGVQRWTTHADTAGRYRADVHELEPDLAGIRVTPRFGIGHRALALRTPAGVVLWEPVGYVDDDLVARVQTIGPVVAVAASHPHLVGAAVSWARACEVPYYVNSADRRWVQRPDPRVRYWDDRVEVLPGVTLVRAGGHFPGSAVLHWAAGAQGRGVLLVGDTLLICPDGVTVSFMRSYPNLIPLPERSVRGIQAALAPLGFDRLYGGFDGAMLAAGAKAAVQFSADRYVGWLRDDLRDPDEPGL